MKPRTHVPEQRPGEGTFEWVIPPTEGAAAFGDIIFSDGSMKDGPGELESLGFGFVVYRAGRVVAKARGVPPRYIHGNYGAELWGLVQAARHTVGPREVKVDNEAVVKRFAAGRNKTLHGDTLYAEAWGQLFAIQDGEQLAVTWTKGHITNADVEAERFTQFEKDGNDIADELAKSAANQFRYLEEFRDEIERGDALVAQVAKAIGQMTAYVLETGGDHVQPPAGRFRAKARKVKTIVPPLTVAEGGHQWIKEGNRWCCENCPRSVRSKDKHLRRLCPSSFRAGLGSHAGRSHSHWSVGKVIFCGRCGAYSAHRLRGLADACRGKPSGLGAQTRLRKLRDGIHPTKGTWLGRPRLCKLDEYGKPCPGERCLQPTIVARVAAVTSSVTSAGAYIGALPEGAVVSPSLNEAEPPTAVAPLKSALRRRAADGSVPPCKRRAVTFTAQPDVHHVASYKHVRALWHSPDQMGCARRVRPKKGEQEIAAVSLSVEAAASRAASSHAAELRSLALKRCHSTSEDDVGDALRAAKRARRQAGRHS